MLINVLIKFVNKRSSFIIDIIKIFLLIEDINVKICLIRVSKLFIKLNYLS